VRTAVLSADLQGGGRGDIKKEKETKRPSVEKTIIQTTGKEILPREVVKTLKRRQSSMGKSWKEVERKSMKKLEETNKAPPQIGEEQHPLPFCRCSRALGQRSTRQEEG